MTDVVGVLFGKPDGIVWRYQYAHNAILSMGRRHLLKSLGARVKVGQVVTPHFAEPDPPLVVNGGPHQPAVRLRQWVFMKDTRCPDRR
jgi:hypothetical protein